MTKGWLKISEPQHLETALVRMLNRILASDDPIAHAGRFASLANCWINAKRLELESGEWQEIKARLDLVEQVLAFNNQQDVSYSKENIAKLKEKVKVFEAYCK
jgi:hypothetical protein